MKVSVSRTNDDKVQNLLLFEKYIKSMPKDKKKELDKVLDSYLYKAQITEILLEILTKQHDMEGYVLLTKLVNSMNIFTDTKNEELTKLGIPKECHFNHFILKVG